MKHISYFLSVFFCSTLFLSSCESEIESEIQSSAEKLVESTKTRAITTDSLTSDSITVFKMTDELKSLRERMDELNQTKTRTASSNYNQYFAENMWAIRELPFTLRTKNGYLYTARGEQKVSYYTSRRDFRPSPNRPSSPDRPTSNRPSRPTTSSTFYVKILPATSGIPYLIYASQTNTPLGVGHYTSNPDQKVVFIMNNNSTADLFVSWNIIPATNNPGYYVIQNEGYIGQGSSGSWWDIFNYVIETKGSDASFGQYSQKMEQEFTITPDASFILKSLEFINPYSVTIIQRDNLPIQQATINPSPQLKRENLTFTKNVEENSYFEEEKGIAFRVKDTDSLRFARPTVTLGEIDLIPNMQIPADTKYEPNVRKIFEKKLYQQVPVVVNPRTKLVMTYYYKVYDVSIDYVATIKYQDRVAKVPGRWSGRIYVDEIFEPDFEEINLDTQRSIKGKVSTKNTTLSSPVRF